MFVLGWSFGILSPKSLPLSSENKLVSHLWQSAEPLRPFLTKWWKESSSICSICSLRMLLGGKTTRTTRYICTICISFAIAQSWCIRLCSKLSAKLQHVSARDEQQLLSVHLWAKKHCNFLTPLLKRQLLLYYKSQHRVSDDITAASLMLSR